MRSGRSLGAFLEISGYCRSVTVVPAASWPQLLLEALYLLLLFCLSPHPGCKYTPVHIRKEFSKITQRSNIASHFHPKNKNVRLRYSMKQNLGTKRRWRGSAAGVA